MLSSCPLDELLNGADGYTGSLFLFHLVDNHEAVSNRAVVGFYDETSNKLYTGVVTVHGAGDPLIAFKEHLKSVQKGNNVQVRIVPEKDGRINLLAVMHL